MSNELGIVLDMLPRRFAKWLNVTNVEVEDMGSVKTVIVTGEFSGHSIQVPETLTDGYVMYVPPVMCVDVNVYDEGHVFEEYSDDLVSLVDEFYEEIEGFLEAAGYEPELGYGYGDLLDGETDEFMSLRRITLCRDPFNLTVFTNLLSLIGNGNYRIKQEKERLGL